MLGASESTQGRGVYGNASAGSGDATGVLGTSSSTGGVGVLGMAWATSGETSGVAGLGSSPTGAGVSGWSAEGTGVLAYSGPPPRPSAPPMTGVFGFAGQDGGRGGVFGGAAAQIRLIPAAGPHPTTGELGDLHLDDGGSHWLCKGGTAWKQLD